MTYNAELTFKFDATWTRTYTGGFGSTVDSDFLPEEHYLITAPAADLSATQYFKLFEKFMLCVGMCPSSIRSGAMSLVFNDMVNEEEQRKVCKEYEITMDEDLEKKYQEWKERDAQWAKLNAHYEKNFGGSEPKIKGDWDITTDEENKNHPSWEERYLQIYRRFEGFAKYTDNDLKKMRTMYDTLYSEDVDSADGVS
jgi:hypothetical protein